MRTLRPLNNKELAEALSHLHVMTRVFLAQESGEDVADPVLDSSRPTVNRFLDFLQAQDAGQVCVVDRENTPRAVVGALLTPEGVVLLLEPQGPAA